MRWQMRGQGTRPQREDTEAPPTGTHGEAEKPAAVPLAFLGLGGLEVGMNAVRAGLAQGQGRRHGEGEHSTGKGEQSLGLGESAHQAEGAVYLDPCAVNGARRGEERGRERMRARRGRRYTIRESGGLRFLSLRLPRSARNNRVEMVTGFAWSGGAGWPACPERSEGDAAVRSKG
jgi:hypothetical protein